MTPYLYEVKKNNIRFNVYPEDLEMLIEMGDITSNDTITPLYSREQILNAVKDVKEKVKGGFYA